MADRTALARATEASDAPTPGYLYLDIAKNAASSPMACQEIATYLTRRLASKNNHNVKYKCLKVIAKTAESPVTRGQFKRIICQDPNAVASIKEALQFRGPPDPARGDEIYQRVRDAAKEALDAVYSDTPSSSDYQQGGGGGGAASSYGHAPHQQHGGGAPGAGGASRRMEGIGNPMFQDPRHAAAEKGIGDMTIGEVIGVAGEAVAGMIKDPLAKNAPIPPPGAHRGGSSMPGYGGGGGYSGPPGRSQLSQATGGQWTMASNRGPHAVGGTTAAPPANFNPAQQDSAYYKARENNSFQWASQQQNQSGASASGGGVGGSWGSVNTAVPAGGGGGQSVASQARAPAHGGAFAPPTGGGGTAVSDGSYEKNLVMELCPPGGMKAEPPPDKLANFSRAVPSLNADLVCPALLDLLEDGQPWIIRAKALCVMETAIVSAEKTKGEGENNAYADFFHACLAEIEPLASHPRMAIKEPAKRVLRALGVDSGRAGTAATGRRRAAPPAAAPPAPAADLLGFDDAPAPAPPVAAPPTAPPPEASPPSQPPPAAAAGGDSLFGGMQVKNSSAAPATNAPPVPAAEPAPAPGLFGDVKVKEATPSAPAAETQDTTKPAAATGSAFGFMNEGGGAQPEAAASTAAKETAAPERKSSKDFDPLLTMQPTTAASSSKAPMQLSTEQMQAMAYQQMMMQQQMQMQQMQQMQMAMAMQQGRMGGTTPNPMMMQQQMQAAGGSMPPRQGSHRSIMQSTNAGATASGSFSFLDVGAEPPKKDDKKFDFVKDALKDESKK